MDERTPPPPPITNELDDEAPLPWSREGDELLLLDGLEEIDEAPDDERVDELL